MFFKKATKIDKIFTVNLTVVSVKLTVKISSIFVAFFEKTNFNTKMAHYPKGKLIAILYSLVKVDQNVSSVIQFFDIKSYTFKRFYNVSKLKQVELRNKA